MSDFSLGKISATGNPYDLALLGEGFFTVKSPSQGLLYTRNGQFQRDGEGRLVTASGAVLQADGGDLVLRGGAVTIAPDGAVLEDGEPTARLDLMASRDPAALMRSGEGFTADPADMTAVAAPAVRQGAVETSNVELASEMITLMQALRRAETGQRLAMVYDDLMGRAVTTFGQA